MVTFLKKAQSIVPKKTAKFYLHQHLSGFEEGRSMANVHASSLTKPEGFCPREYALSDVLKKKPKEQWLSTSERLTFQIGRDVERNIVLWFAEMGRAVCDWKCMACGSMHKFTLRPEHCSACNFRKLEPVELRFKSGKNSASCGVDMMLHLNEAKLVPHEIKTMDKDQFKALEAPLAEHRLRGKLYLRLIAESTDPNAKKVDTSRMFILYTTKGGYGCADPEVKKMGFSDGFSPFKEYEIKRDDKEVEDIMLRAQVLHDFRQGLVGMPQGICPSAMSARAAKCHCKTQCFSGDHPPAYEWKST